MPTWLTVVLIIVVIAVLVAIGLAVSRRQATAKKESQARDHLNEARERQARAESTRAAAEEKAASLRRERAELEQRAAQHEREAAQLAEDADRDQAKATELTARARKLAPHLSQNDAAAVADRDTDPDHAGYADLSGYQAGAGSHDSHQGVDDHTRLDLPAGQRYEDDTAAPEATTYRHTAPVTDPDAVSADTTLRDRDDARVDSDGDGRPDGSLRERVDGDADTRETVVDSDGERPHNDRPSLKERLTGRPDNR